MSRPSPQETIDRIARVVAENAEPDYVAERRLPRGKTCNDCQHRLRCEGLFGAVSKSFTSCDFWPSRFRPFPKSENLSSGEAQ